MIGKMYRPLKILNIPGKRGFSILNKYKSNLGFTYKFETEIYLKYNAETNTEEVHIEFKNLEIPVYTEKGHKVNKTTVISSLEQREIESLRKMVRPTKISSKDSLDFAILIESSKDETENDTLELSFMPIVVDEEEFMKVEVNCQTPVVIHSKATIEFAEKE